MCDTCIISDTLFVSLADIRLCRLHVLSCMFNVTWFFFAVCSSHVDPDLCRCLVQWSDPHYFGYVAVFKTFVFVHWIKLIFAGLKDPQI